MSELILATATDRKYFDRALPYLKTISKHSQLDNFCFCLDFEPDVILPNVAVEVVDSTQLLAPLNNACIQHGEFVRLVDFAPDDVIIFTDADLRMQRPFTEEELDGFRGLAYGQFSAGYNAGPKDTLRAEGARLGYLKSVEELEDAFGNLDSPCYNVGVAAARVDTWEFILGLYCELFPEICTFFDHVARQQWLISWIANSYLEPIVMSNAIHSHGHYNLPAGCQRVGSEIYFMGSPCVFRHKL